MISRLRALTGVGASLALFILIAASARSFGVSPGFTGAPGEGLCTSCHPGSPANSGPGGVSLDAPPHYTPGMTYDFNVTVSDPTASRFGFQVVAKDGADDFQGTWEIVDPADTRFSSPDANYVTHVSAPFGSGSHAFAVRWTAPGSDVGDITFYAAGNGADGGGQPTGDQIYTAVATSAPSGSSSSESAPALPSFQLTDVFPIPFVDHTTFRFELSRPGAVDLVLYDLSGRELRSESFGTFGIGSHSARLNGAGLPSGVIVYRLVSGGEEASGRLIHVR